MNARYFDGVDARLHAVTVAVTGGEIAIDGAGIARRVPVAATHWSAPTVDAPAMLYLADGALCEVQGGDRAALARALGVRSRGPGWRMLRTLGAVTALALLAAVAVLAASRLFPAAANVAVQVMPARIDEHLGRWALAGMIDDGTLQPSRIAPALAREAQQVLTRVTPAHPRVPLQLRIFNSRTLGINAEALPDGTIVVTDQLIRTLSGKASTMNAFQQAVLAGVLAHEIGHLEARDTVRILVGSSMMEVASAVLFGDFSDGVAASSAGLVSLRYARGQETAADGWAIARMRQLNLPLTPMADWLEAADAWDARVSHGRQPPVPIFLSTHPATIDRTARLRAADHGRQMMDGR